MPIFEYQCDACNTRFEEIVFGSQAAPVCPKCGKSTTLVPSCASLHMPAPSRVGQTVTFPKSSRSACSGCSGGNCSTCK